MKNSSDVYTIEELQDNLWQNFEQELNRRRKYISDAISFIYNKTVQAGPFKGLILGEKSFWSEGDKGAMLLGLYEKEIVDSLFEISGKYRYFINIGASDGYYGIGVLVNNLFEKSWCFEMFEDSRNILRNTAKANNVEDRVIIHGMADCNFYKDFSDDIINQSVLFVDAEGSEFFIFNEEVFKKFKDSVIFIELHDFYYSDGKERLENLKQYAEKFFKITTLTTTSRDLSPFKELAELNDTDRWLICSEGRLQLMNWWRLDPKRE